MKIPGWIQRPDILTYIVEAYAGTDLNEHNKKRRVFIWQEGEEIIMGNCEAFAEHLRERFELVHALSGMTPTIHNLLRQLGEQVQAHKEHAPRTGPGGSFKQPEPDKWVIGKAKEAEDGD